MGYLLMNDWVMHTVSVLGGSHLLDLLLVPCISKGLIPLFQVL
jgi:hypothetical protein